MNKEIRKYCSRCKEYRIFKLVDGTTYRCPYCGQIHSVGC